MPSVNMWKRAGDPQSFTPSLTAPIFINAFSRGGSSIVWNMLQSHPDVVSPLEETHQLFIGNSDDGTGRHRRKALVHLRHALAGGGVPRPAIIDGHIFANLGLLDPGNFSPRRLPRAVRIEVDDALATARARNLTDPDFRWRTAAEAYVPETLAPTRLVSKNIDGMLWLSPDLSEMYPDATFVGLVRNGLAVCESHLRRKSYPSAHKFGVVYRLLVREMLSQARRIERYRIFRFEDVVRSPVDFMNDLYEHTGLAPGSVQMVRLKNKAHFDASGNYGRASDEGSHVWMDVSQLSTFLNEDVNALQEQRLSAEDRRAFLDAAGEEMAALGYA